MEFESLDHIQFVNIGDLSYCDPAAGSADHALVDIHLQPRAGDLVATLNLDKERALKYFKDLKPDMELVIGTVIELRQRGLKPPPAASE